MAMRFKVNYVGDVVKEKSYFVLPLTIESDGKTKEQKIYSFNDATYKVMKEAKAGEQYDVDLEKDKNGYWQWKNPRKVEGVAGGAAVASRGGYETPAERARRQTLIIRQSAIASAVALVQKGEGNIPVASILEVATEFENWVNRDFDPENHPF